VARRAKALARGEVALPRLQRLLGKYDYRRRRTIEARIEQALRHAHVHRYLTVTLDGTDADQAWRLTWTVDHATLDVAARFDGVVLLCRNVPPERCARPELVVEHKGQIGVEQTIDFLKSRSRSAPCGCTPPPAWRGCQGGDRAGPAGLHFPTRLAGLTRLLMLAGLVAALVEHQVRCWIARTGELLHGRLPEGRDNP
jgi:hypothetical protein